MKILYGIQGTGHGHISRAREILPGLMEKYEIDILVSGYNTNLKLNQEVKYYKHGVSFLYEKGGISFTQSVKKFRPFTFAKDVLKLDLSSYDLVISDFEPITAWAAKHKGVPSLSMSHQAAFVSPHTPRPSEENGFAEWIMKNYAPCDNHIGFHFDRYDSFILPPVIRKEVRDLTPYSGNHVTVYLPAFDDHYLENLFKPFDDVEWHVFSPYIKKKRKVGSVYMIPVNNAEFLNSLEGCSGLVTSSGFEACAEAMFLGKRLLTIPIQYQYEQYCNAAALEKMGIRVVHKGKHEIKEQVEIWLDEDERVKLSQFSIAQDIIDVMEKATTAEMITDTRYSYGLMG